MDSENHDDEFMNVLPPQTVTMARKAYRDTNKADKLPPSPPALKKRSSMNEKYDCITIDENETDFQDLMMIRPKIVEFNGRRIAPFILFLPFYCFDPKWITVAVSSLQATITLSLPQHLMHPNRISGQKCKESHIVYQTIYSLLRHSVEKRGDAYTFKIVLDLPFAAEPFLATDVLYKNKREIPTVHTYTGPNFPDEATYIDSCEPYNFCDSLVLLFQEQEDNFEVEIAVSSMKLLNLTNSSDDESFEW